jgi:aldehyde:ferredoxin oxidoreductase
MKGHAGKILKVDLSHKEITMLETEKYEQWAGGHGIGTAIFFDLCKDKTVGCFDPGNTIVIMTGLFAGTLVPGACRMELVGIQAQSYPIEWFGRSNCGGRFPAILKFAGYDGIILEGAAHKPTWISIIDGDVELRDARGLWGLRTYETQRAIFRDVGGPEDVERPAVLTIGPAGENQSRIATIQHDAGCAFGQGGFGGIWGAKNLKAISVIGTGGVEVADPKGLMDARLWAEENYAYDSENPRLNPWQEFITSHFGGHPNRQWTPFDRHRRRSSGCWGCHINCKSKTASGLGNESHCADALFYQNWDLNKHGRVTEISGKATDLLQDLGINAQELYVQMDYLNTLYETGVIGRGKEINTDLQFNELGELEFVERLLHKIAYRIEIGDDLAEGFPRAAERWGRLEEDLSNGNLQAPFWGYPIHYDPRTEVYWGYASIVSSRDICSHDFNVGAYWMPTLDIMEGRNPLVSAEELAEIVSSKTAPYNDPRMIDFGDNNLYSEHMARTTAWLLHYSLFWKQSCGLCDNAFADFLNPYGPNNRGLTPQGEVRFFKAVTGKRLSFVKSMEIGRKIWNLDRAIWVLQGRHRDMEQFPDFVYNTDAKGTSYVPGKPPAYYSPVFANGTWKYRDIVPRRLCRDGVERWKTRFYKLEQWDPKTGWPTRKTLEALDLRRVADEMEKHGKLP